MWNPRQTDQTRVKEAATFFTYRGGSIYQALETRQIFVVALTILITTILLLGLLRR